MPFSNIKKNLGKKYINVKVRFGKGYKTPKLDAIYYVETEVLESIIKKKKKIKLETHDPNCGNHITGERLKLIFHRQTITQKSKRNNESRSNGVACLPETDNLHRYIQINFYSEGIKFSYWIHEKTINEIDDKVTVFPVEHKSSVHAVLRNIILNDTSDHTIVLKRMKKYIGLNNLGLKYMDKPLMLCKTGHGNRRFQHKDTIRLDIQDELFDSSSDSDGSLSNKSLPDTICIDPTKTLGDLFAMYDL